jgi:hypothetical protein
MEEERRDGKRLSRTLRSLRLWFMTLSYLTVLKSFEWCSEVFA